MTYTERNFEEHIEKFFKSKVLIHINRKNFIIKNFVQFQKIYLHFLKNTNKKINLLKKQYGDDFEEKF